MPCSVTTIVVFVANFFPKYFNTFLSVEITCSEVFRGYSMTSLLKRGATYEEVCDNFSWNIPEQYNIADDVCDGQMGRAELL